MLELTASKLIQFRGAFKDHCEQLKEKNVHIRDTQACLDYCKQYGFLFEGVNYTEQNTNPELFDLLIAVAKEETEPMRRADVEALVKQYTDQTNSETRQLLEQLNSRIDQLEQENREQDAGQADSETRQALVQLGEKSLWQEIKETVPFIGVGYSALSFAQNHFNDQIQTLGHGRPLAAGNFFNMIARLDNARFQIGQHQAYQFFTDNLNDGLQFNILVGTAELVASHIVPEDYSDSLKYLASGLYIFSGLLAGMRIGGVNVRYDEHTSQLHMIAKVSLSASPLLLAATVSLLDENTLLFVGGIGVGLIVANYGSTVMIAGKMVVQTTVAALASPVFLVAAGGTAALGAAYVYREEIVEGFSYVFDKAGEGIFYVVDKIGELGATKTEELVAVDDDDQDKSDSAKKDDYQEEGVEEAALSLKSDAIAATVYFNIPNVGRNITIGRDFCEEAEKDAWLLLQTAELGEGEKTRVREEELDSSSEGDEGKVPSHIVSPTFFIGELGGDGKIGNQVAVAWGDQVPNVFNLDVCTIGGATTCSISEPENQSNVQGGLAKTENRNIETQDGVVTGEEEASDLSVITVETGNQADENNIQEDQLREEELDPRMREDDESVCEDGGSMCEDDETLQRHSRENGNPGIEDGVVTGEEKASDLSVITVETRIQADDSNIQEDELREEELDPRPHLRQGFGRQVREDDESLQRHSRENGNPGIKDDLVMKGESLSNEEAGNLGTEVETNVVDTAGKTENTEGGSWWHFW